MLEFQGEISEKCRHYIFSKEKMIARIGAAIAAGLFSIPVIILAITWDWIIVIALPVLILFVILAGTLPSKKNLSLIIPEKITICSDVIKSESEKFHYDRMVSQVKKVVDMGEWYHIYFYYHYRNPRFICQKDLIK